MTTSPELTVTSAKMGTDMTNHLMTRHQDAVQTQVKTRERVRDLAEVYTHKREVDAMLDLVPEMFPSAASPRNIGRTFLEPACGSGNFLVAILERKLAFVTTRVYRSQATLETAVLTALSSVYGIDIDPANVQSSRSFMRAEIAHHMNEQLNTVAVSEGFFPAVEATLVTNIVCADTLTDAGDIELVEYRWERKTGFVTREWSLLESDDSNQLDLFGDSYMPRRDAVAVHYSQLAHQIEPIGAG